MKATPTRIHLLWLSCGVDSSAHHALGAWGNQQEDGWMPLHFAAARGKLSLARFLVNAAGAVVHASDDNVTPHPF